MENELIDKNHVIFESKDNEIGDKTKEQAAINNINLCFAKYADAINAQDGTINVYFDKKGEPQMYLDNMSEDLKTILHQHADLF